MRSIRLLAVASVAVTLLSLDPVASTAAAATPGCSAANHCYSVLRTGSTSSTLYQGMYGTWNRAYMSAGCTTTNQQDMNSEMWFWPFSGGWVEVGHKAGWLSNKSACDYWAFGAWEKEDGTGFTRVWLATLDHNDSTTDEFQLSRSSSTNVFRLYFNGVYKTSDNVQFWNSRRMQVGAEVKTPDGNSHTFNMYGAALDSGGVHHNLTSPQTPVVDSPPLWGASSQNSEWSWHVQ